MGPQEAPGMDALKRLRAWRLLWLPAVPEAAFGRPMTEGHRGPRAISVGSVSPWWVFHWARPQNSVMSPLSRSRASRAALRWFW